MDEETAKAMMIRAIEAGIYHDLGSGSNVDVCVLKANNKYTMYRNIKSDNFKAYSKPGGYTFDKDKLVCLGEYKNKIVVEEGPQPMDLS